MSQNTGSCVIFEHWRNGQLVERIVKLVSIINKGTNHLLNVTFPTKCRTFTVWPPLPGYREGQRTMNHYIMSKDAPRLILYDIGDLLEGVSDVVPCIDQSSTVLDGDYWPNHVSQTLGFVVMDRFPVYSDGSGCHVLVRRGISETFAFKNHRARSYQYLALLDVAHGESIVVAIKNAAALLQFYRLIHPMLMLQSEPRFSAGMVQRKTDVC